MDAAPRTTRRFPGYTLAELEAFVAAGTAAEGIEAEIAARKAGASTVYRVPQVEAQKARRAAVLRAAQDSGRLVIIRA